MNSIRIGRIGRIGFWLLLLMPLVASAQVRTLKDIAQKAVLSNPEVQQRWHAYQASVGERDAAFGGYLPKLDLSVGPGRESRESPTVRGDYSINSRSLTLTQMLYDGFATRNDVKRLSHARLVRQFELQEISENVALEAMRAYFDVNRFRRLVSLAEDNYVRHRSVFEQIQRKVKAGVARGVDLEQAAGRLALAESNLLTETSNLHDVSARFQRIVGEAPAKDFDQKVSLSKGLPPDMGAAQRMAQLQNPTLQAAVENVRAADAAADVRKAAYQPRVDLRLRQERDNNLGGILGRTNTDTAEVVLSWNLFNGMSDLARSRQFAEQKNLAKDVRDKTCRDIRQTLAIAYNDTRKLSEQLNYLDQHQLSIEKARDAYRKQFDIGQRTLLDLLDTENEYFQAKRAYTNAEYDLEISYGRSHAGFGNLLAALGLSRYQKESLPDMGGWSPGEDAAEKCPAEGPPTYVVDKAALDARAEESLREAAAILAAAAAAANANTPTRAPGADTAKVDGTKSDPAKSQQEIRKALNAWIAAWSSRNVEQYLASYAPDYSPAAGVSREAWAARRRALIERAGEIQLEVSDIEFVAQNQAQRMVTHFTQAYRSRSYSDVVRKTLEWQLSDGKWLIIGESGAPVR